VAEAHVCFASHLFSRACVPQCFHLADRFYVDEVHGVLDGLMRQVHDVTRLGSRRP
jgi:hypothetical protein